MRRNETIAERQATGGRHDDDRLEIPKHMPEAEILGGIPGLRWLRRVPDLKIRRHSHSYSDGQQQVMYYIKNEVITI